MILLKRAAVNVFRDRVCQLFDPVDSGRIRRPTAFLQCSADDGSASNRQQSIDGVDGHTAADEDRCREFVTGASRDGPVERVSVDCLAGVGAADDHAVGQPPLDGIGQPVTDGPPASEWRRVFDVDVGQNLRVDTELLAEAYRFVGPSLDHTLIGDGRASVDVDPDELGLKSRRNRECSLGVVPQNVDSDGAVDGPSHGGSDPGHRRHSVFRDTLREYRGVT